MDADQYTPEVMAGGIGKIIVRLDTCPGCERYTLHKLDEYTVRALSPLGYSSLIDQMARAGWVFRSRTRQDDDYICIECEAGDKSTFDCALCGQSKPSSKSYGSFGDPPEHLCKDCYASVPAKEWDRKCEELRNAHRYDYD